MQCVHISLHHFFPSNLHLFYLSAIPFIERLLTLFYLHKNAFPTYSSALTSLLFPASQKDLIDLPLHVYTIGATDRLQMV